MFKAALTRITYFRLLGLTWQYAGLAGQQRQMKIMYALLVTANLLLLTRPLMVGEIVVTILAGGPHLVRDLCLWLLALVGSMGVYLLIVCPAITNT